MDDEIFEEQFEKKYQIVEQQQKIIKEMNEYIRKSKDIADIEKRNEIANKINEFRLRLDSLQDLYSKRMN